MSLQTWQETLIVAPGDGPALTAAAAARCIPATGLVTLPPNFWAVGRAMRIKASGKITSVITTPGTARFDVRMTASVVFDSLAILLDSVAAHTNVGWLLEIILTCRAIGATGNLFGQGKWTCEDILGVPATPPKGVLSAILPWNSAPAVGGNFDTTISHILDLYFTQTAATGSLTLNQFLVEMLN